MKKTTSLPSVFANLLMCILFLNFQETKAQGFSPETGARLLKVLQAFQNDPSYVGGISAAIRVDGLASWQGATGYAARNTDAQNNLLPGGSPFTTSTLSRIYSPTKTFTAALTLELAREGAFNLDDAVSRYLPLNQVNPGLTNSVTIRQLLAHESGYSDYTGEMQFLLSVAFQPTHVWSPFEVIYFVHQENLPGAVRKYSSTNYIILGAIIESVTGKAIEKHYRERFFNPLGLQSMYLGVRESQPAGSVLASPHDNISAFNPIFQLTGQPTFPNAYTNVSRFPFDGIVSAAFTGGGIVSNAMDLASWCNDLFTGRATSNATLEAMLSSLSSSPDAQGDYLGYGIWRSTRMSATETFLGHDGNAPGYKSVMFYQPDKKLSIVVLANFYGADIYAIAKALYEALPAFNCHSGNKNEKITVCHNGKALCVDHHAADELIKKGSYLGPCEGTTANSKSKSNQVIHETHPNTSTLQAFSISTNKVLFRFSSDISGPVRLDLYDMSGKLVQRLFNGTLQKGTTGQVSYEKQNLAQGVYISVLKTPSGRKQQKIVLQ